MTFQTELLDQLGDASDAWDIRASVRRCFFYDFDGYPIRLWHGQGVLIDSTGSEWMGMVTADGADLHAAPELRDPRDGTAPRYEFGMPFVDKATFDALKADQDLVAGRELTVYHVIVKHGEGLRPGTALRFSQKLVMRGVRFEEGMAEGQPGELTKTYSAWVVCRPLEYGRSQFPGGTYTDTSQQQRAALLGVSTDSGCSMIAGNSQRTYVFD